MKISFDGSMAEVLSQMQDFLETVGGEESESAPAADGTAPAKRVRRTKAQIAADNAAAVQAAAAQSGAPSTPAPTPITNAPSAQPAASVELTLEQAQTALKQAVGVLGEKDGPVIIHGILTKEFGVERTKDLPAERRTEFVKRLAEVTAPKAPSAAGLL